MKSVGKEKVVKERAKGWEDVNGEGAKKKSKNVFGELGEKKGDREWVSDEDMDEEVKNGEGEVQGTGKEEDAVVAPESVALPVAEDEML